MDVLTRSAMQSAYVEAALRANIEFPQSDAATTCYVGNIAATRFLEPDYSVATFAAEQMTDAHVEQAAVAAQRAHAAFGIGCIMVEKIDLTDPRPQFTRDRLIGAAVGGQTGTLNVIRYYAGSVLGDGPMPVTTQGRGEEAAALGDELFAPGARGIPKAEALGLVGIWKTASDLLKMPDAKAIMASYRETLRGMASPDVELFDWELMLLRTKTASPLLRDLLTQKLRTQLAQIVTDAGTTVPARKAAPLASWFVPNAIPPRVPIHLRGIDADTRDAVKAQARKALRAEQGLM